MNFATFFTVYIYVLCSGLNSHCTLTVYALMFIFIFTCQSQAERLRRREENENARFMKHPTGSGVATSSGTDADNSRRETVHVQNPNQAQTMTAVINATRNSDAHTIFDRRELDEMRVNVLNNGEEYITELF